MAGKLYGIGVGSGDPELLTLKAVRIIKESTTIAIPKTKNCVAYQIAKQVIEDLDKKELLALSMPMTKEKQILKESHISCVEKIIACLEQNKQVAFLTLGDPTIYSTYLYLHQLVIEKGYQAEIINGIPSFCAAAAKAGIGLVEQAQVLHIIPASYPIKESLNLSGTKVFMKAGKQLEKRKEEIKQIQGKAVMIENCGMKGEKIYKDLNEVKEASYYSLIIVKEK